MDKEQNYYWKTVSLTKGFRRAALSLSLVAQLEQEVRQFHQLSVLNCDVFIIGRFRNERDGTISFEDPKNRFLFLCFL